ncbi:MAG: putative transcriptional regulator [Myxococcota bacterium]|jgi:putative transcriptional regulator
MDPRLLIASPQMQDPNFRNAVVLVFTHDEDGAMGVVVNRLLEHTLPEVLKLEADRELNLDAYRDTRVAWGGPVQEDAGIVVTRGQVSDAEGTTLAGGLGITGSRDALERLISAQEQVLLCVGYAGWGAGQLDSEIEQGSWLWTDCDAALVFDTPPDDRYDAALASLGLTRNMVWMQPIDE